MIKIFPQKTILASLLIIFMIITAPLRAGEGMWLPIFLKQLNEAEMKKMGMKISAEDIYSVNKGSLKDAIVHFGGGCTGEIISAKGLLLTNHHCGYSQIQRHSSLENNYLENGFWALTHADELPNPGLSATFIVRIEDVTQKVFRGIKRKTSADERKKIIQRNIDQLLQTVPKKTYEDAFIRPFFHANQYFLFITVTYKDVRLVGAPPSSIGKFGADTDNWEWPRHTGDFALFRIYANKNNEPAEYSESNVPFTPRHFLPISMDGLSEGDFTMVYGFPGRTDQYIPSYGVKMITQTLNPVKIEIRREVLSRMDRQMRADPQTKIDYASKYASIANAYKKWIGENQGIERVDGIGRKIAYEQEFQNRVQQRKKWRNNYSQLLNEFDQLYQTLTPLARMRDIYSEVLGRNSAWMSLASQCHHAIATFEIQGAEQFVKKLGFLSQWPVNKSRNNDPLEHQILSFLIQYMVHNLQVEELPLELRPMVSYNAEQIDQYIAELYQNSFISKNIDPVTSGVSPNELYHLLKNDPLVKLYSDIMHFYQNTIAIPLGSAQSAIDAKMQLYMQAQMEVFSNKRFYPDANSTLRITYGRVEGYKPRDAVQYIPMTYLKGVIEKYQPGDYEFDVPKRLLDLSRTKNFGKYADKTGDVPVAFLGSNHTTGGNSGSPAIDAYGNLVGLNFDRVWEGTMSDLIYDPSICRNIMVDIRYILFIIDKFANAGHLIKEMKLVYPKSAPGNMIMQAVESHQPVSLPIVE